MNKLTLCIEWDPETCLYAGFVLGVRGAHSQGESINELFENLKEVLDLCLEVNISDKAINID